ncbi:MAG: UPF0280 family protein [Peptococcaceae bacterium]
MITILNPGVVFLDYGPISMTISAWNKNIPLTHQCVDASQVAIKHLQEISCNLKHLKKPWLLCEKDILTGAAFKMWQAAKSTGDTDLTPMAAVAGVMADRTADWLMENGATKVIVNNGGDIALRLMNNEQASVGIVPQLGRASFSHKVLIKSSDHIGGIATSGLGGRSFTRGIADSVTVFAKNCITADVFATSLANSSYIDCPGVKQAPAETIDPNTDIPGIMITISVGPLNLTEKQKSLRQIEKKSQWILENNLITGAIAHVQGEKLEAPGKLLTKIKHLEVNNEYEIQETCNCSGRSTR